MKAFVEYLVKAIVKHTDDVIVAEETFDNTQVYTIDVNPEDMGIVIGKQGKIIRSIRDLVKAKAIKEDKHIRIELNEIDKPQTL